MSKTKQLIQKISNIYLGIPSASKSVLPIIIANHFTVAFCLNMAAYFKKIDHLHYGAIGELISFFYWGCLLGALIGGMLTLKYKATKISGIGLLALGPMFYPLFATSDKTILFITLLMLGLLSSIVAISNFSILLQTSKNIESVKLKLISLELILFNICYSITSYILLDLEPNQIIYFIKLLVIIITTTGGYSLIKSKKALFIKKRKQKTSFKNMLPEDLKSFCILMSMVLTFGLIFSMVKVIFTPTIINRFGSSYLSVLIAFVNPWLMCGIQPLIIEKIKATRSPMVLGVGGVIVGLSYFIFGMSTTFMFSFIALVTLTIGEMLFGPLSKLLNGMLFGGDKDGYAVGMWKAVFLGSGTIGPYISGFIAEKYGAVYVWDICAILGLICFILSIILSRMTLSHQKNSLTYSY